MSNELSEIKARLQALEQSVAQGFEAVYAGFSVMKKHMDDRFGHTDQELAKLDNKFDAAMTVIEDIKKKVYEINARK